MDSRMIADGATTVDENGSKLTYRGQTVRSGSASGGFDQIIVE